MNPRSLTMMNAFGDVTIMWEEENDAAMEGLITKNMAEGVTFFIVEPVAGGLMPPKKTAAPDVPAAMRARALSIDDADLEAFCGEGKGTLVKATGRRKTIKRATSAKEVATGQSVGLKPRKGG